MGVRFRTFFEKCFIWVPPLTSTSLRIQPYRCKIWSQCDLHRKDRIHNKLRRTTSGRSPSQNRNIFFLKSDYKKLIKHLMLWYNDPKHQAAGPLVVCIGLLMLAIGLLLSAINSSRRLLFYTQMMRYKRESPSTSFVPLLFNPLFSWGEKFLFHRIFFRAVSKGPPKAAVHS